MLEFLKEQLAKIEEELKKLYTNRARAGVEAVGSYENMIANKKAEYKRLKEEIADFEGTKTATPAKDSTATSTPTAATPKQHISNLVADGKLQEAIEAMQAQWDDTSIILLSSRLRSTEKQWKNGLVSQADYELSKNRITNAVLATLKDL